MKFFEKIFSFLNCKKKNSKQNDNLKSTAQQSAQLPSLKQQSLKPSYQLVEKKKQIQKLKKQQQHCQSNNQTQSHQAAKSRKQQQIYSQIHQSQTLNQDKQLPQQNESTDSSLIPNEMLQDDEIFEPINQNLNKKQIYDLEQGISINVQTLNQHFKFNKSQDQIIPVMVSVKTVEQTNEMQIKQNLLEDRPNIDLVCVIDTSGSMGGKKIKRIKQTILQLIDVLNDDDRLSLITFDRNSQKLCGLRKINNQNKANFQKIINSIQAEGNTNIKSGLEKAFSVLQSRNQKNHVSSIFLLSDGQDYGSDAKIKYLLSSTYQQLKDECFTIHSFGFRNDHHDEPLMQKIAQIKDGSFYYIERSDQIDEYFTDALGGLFSVVAQDINISIEMNTQNQIFKKFFKKSYISKTYGSMWKTVNQNQKYAIKINQIFSGISKDFIFEITIPKSEVNGLQDFERNLEVINVKLTAQPIVQKLNYKIVKENKLILTLLTQNEENSHYTDINENFEFNYFRVKAAQAIEEAIQFADKKQYQEGQDILSDMQKKLENSHPNNMEKLNIIKEDLIQCQQNISPYWYKFQGQYQAQQKFNNHIKQQSWAIRGVKDLYQSLKQKQMVSCLQIKKQDQSKK